MGFFAGCLILYVVGGPRVMGGDIPAWQAVLPVLVLCTATVFRSALPLAALAVGTLTVTVELIAGGGMGPVLVYTDLLYAAALYGAPWLCRVLQIGTVAATLAATVALVLIGDRSEGVTTGIIIAVLLISPVWTAVVIRNHKERADAERERAAQIDRLAELDRKTVLQTERTRMARELHDLVANHLSAIAIHSSAVLSLTEAQREKDGTAEEDPVLRALSVIRENSVQGLAEMRRMVVLLRSERGVSDDWDRPQLNALGALVDQARPAADAAGLTLYTELPEKFPEVSSVIEVTAYRIVQEALTNVLKHAAAGRVRIHCEAGAEQLTLSVDSPLARPDGRPRQRPMEQLTAGAGAGLTGMSERAALVGGSFDAGPDRTAPGRWRVRAVLPLTQNP
ncbi:two-component sensor histidine kinase [Streptomyces sp. SID8375]|uniref:sensor histidine kinase n=1 Tax=Streptomyces TaxID=1883 RepID=UPI0003702B33|nr:MULTISPECIES: histidine kinase [unclassified Streptomyces]MYT14151.1 two-component sensor histidine kinase [Streptomyces sp. SID4951]MYX07772.1 two-component sensor histidine kinase [Streptomyces sp. SID8375]SCK58196.1 Signal transduction histidine kinase [Streptomyces sp. SceaMP-e96]